ncbi:MAG: PcfJ domain-containing protein [Dokdonella sp.]|nr:PcfJ domain-containing protein [Dokdonella sp.]
MDTAPAFQLTYPSLPDPDPEQGSLFSTCGLPMPAFVEAQALRARVGAMLATMGLPASHRAGYLDHLCDGGWIDPGLVLWLAAPGRNSRWLDLVEVFAFETQGNAAGGGWSSALDRMLDMQRYARAMRDWPRAAVHSLRRQRSAGGAFDLATLAPLPEGLREWRHALLPVAMQCRALLYAAFAQPTRREIGPDYRITTVLDSFRVHFDDLRRFVTVAIRSPSGFTFPHYAQADLLEPLRTQDWCRCFANRLRQELRVALGAAWAVPHIEEKAADWLVDVVARLAERSRLLPHVRSLIRNAYPLDRRIVRDWHACTIDRRFGQGMLSGEYVWAWRRWEVLRRRVAEAPQLAALWGLAVRLGHIGVEDGYDVLRQQARQHGVTAYGWKLLCRHSTALYRPLIQRNRSATESYVDLFCYVRLLQRAQWGGPMPFAVMQAVFAHYWYVDELDAGELPLGLVRGVIDAIRQPMPLGAQEEFIEHRFALVLGWLARAKPKLDANQQRASWDWYWARYQAWAEKERQRREAQSWTQGIDGLHWRGFDVQPIRDSATLWHDGERMRTCLTTYANECANGRYLVYAVRTPGRPQPVAHIGIHLHEDGTGHLDQVRGFANRGVEPALIEFGKRLARMRHVPDCAIPPAQPAPLA